MDKEGRGKKAGEFASKEDAGSEKAGGEKAGSEKAGGEKAGGEKAGGKKAGGKKAGGKKAGGEKAGSIPTSRAEQKQRKKARMAARPHGEVAEEAKVDHGESSVRIDMADPISNS
jgi:hypothetical protein